MQPLGNPLPLPRNPVASLLESEHVTDAFVRVGSGSCISTVQRHLYWGVPCRLWANVAVRMGRAYRVDVCWACCVVLGTNGKHVPR